MRMPATHSMSNMFMPISKKKKATWLYRIIPLTIRKEYRGTENKSSGNKHNHPKVILLYLPVRKKTDWRAMEAQWKRSIKMYFYFLGTDQIFNISLKHHLQ